LKKPFSQERFIQQALEVVELFECFSAQMRTDVYRFVYSMLLAMSAPSSHVGAYLSSESPAISRHSFICLSASADAPALGSPVLPVCWSLFPVS